MIRGTKKRHRRRETTPTMTVKSSLLLRRESWFKEEAWTLCSTY